MYLMERKSGHLFVTGIEGYKQIDEKGLLYPSESMIKAGALEENRGGPTLLMPDSKVQGTPTAESNGIPLKASTEKRETKEQTEPVTPDQLLEMEQTIICKKRVRQGRGRHGRSIP